MKKKSFIKCKKSVTYAFSTYDYHFIINQQAKEFDGQLECLGEYTENYIFLLKQLRTN